MVDRKNKGGKSLVLRCASAVRFGSDCPFYVKLRRSNRDDLWYICAGLHTRHKCVQTDITPSSVFVERLMAARNTDDNDGKAPATTPHVNMFLASACLDNSI